MASIGLAKSPKHKWTLNNRLTLCLLDHYYDVSTQNKDVTAIFNYVFRQELRQEGFGLGNDAYEAYKICKVFYDMSHGLTGSDVYGRLSKMSLLETRQVYRRQTAAIVNAAEKLRISLRPKTEPVGLKRTRKPEEKTSATKVSVVEFDHGHQTSLTKTHRPIAFMREWSSDSESEYSLTSLSPPRPPSTSALVNHSGKTAPTQRLITPLRVNGRPRLLFRLFNLSHSLRARRYVDPGSIIPSPPGYYSSEFKKCADDHLNRLHSDSPFISLWQNPRNPLSRIKDYGSQHVIAIFEYEKLEEGYTTRFGDRHRIPWLVPLICKDHKLKVFSPYAAKNDKAPYTGRGEVCSGEITRQVLCSNDS